MQSLSFSKLLLPSAHFPLLLIPFNLFAGSLGNPQLVAVYRPLTFWDFLRKFEFQFMHALGFSGTTQPTTRARAGAGA